MLKWVQSYLNSRKQRIKIDGHLSDAFQLPYGVPQGSVLGPLLFTLYTTPLSSVISKFNVTHHLYADDTQIYLELDSRNFDSSITELTNCLEAVQAWMGNNKLKLDLAHQRTDANCIHRKDNAPKPLVPITSEL